MVKHNPHITRLSDVPYVSMRFGQLVNVSHIYLIFTGAVRTISHSPNASAPKYNFLLTLFRGSI